MKKYLFSVLCLMFVAVLAPLAVQAKTDKQAEVMYTPTSEQIETYKKEAQAIGIGTTTVDLKAVDYKVFRLTAVANQAYIIKSGDHDEAYIRWTIYNATGDAMHFWNNFICSDKTEDYYIVVYNDEDAPGTATLEINDAMFKDTITQKEEDGFFFGFVPAVSGTYSFNVQSTYTKHIAVMLEGLNADPEIAEKKDEDFSDTVTAKLEKGKLYIIKVWAQSPYDDNSICYGDEISGKFTLSLAKAPAADAVIDQINKLGAITANSGAAVDAARAAYNALTPAEQKLVSNLATLEAAEKAYADATRPAVGRGKVKALKSTKAKQVLVKWKKVSGANGYQVTYSLKKGFKKAKTVKVSASKAKVTLKKLKSGKVYYVKVRAYKVYRGQTYYGAYSKVKKIKVK